MGGGSAEFVGPEKVKEFLKKHVPKSDQKEINEVFSKNLPLAQQQKKKIANAQPKKTQQVLDRERKTGLEISQNRQKWWIEICQLQEITFLMERIHERNHRF